MLTGTSHLYVAFC